MAGKLDCTSNIGTTERQSRGIPGPGSYQPNHKIAQKSDGAFTIKARYEVKEKEVSPGPGAYAPASESKHGYSFGSSRRAHKDLSGSPGPGTYHIPCEITNMPSYTAARSKDFAYI
jgi:hypothetical protein